MQEFKPSDVRAISFDCYGTLVDWERGILEALAPWRSRVGVDTSDDALLAAYAQAEPEEQQASPKAPYPVILRDAFASLARALGASAPSDAERDAFASTVGDWPVFHDSCDALRRLQHSGLKLVILSNVDHASFTRTNEALGATFDAIVTAEDVGCYKPDVRMFHALRSEIEKMGIPAWAHLHAAQSLYHDIVPANELGIATCWIDRRSGEAGGATRAIAPEAAQPTFVARSLCEFAEVMCE